MTNETKIFCPDCKTKYLLCVEPDIRREKGFVTMVVSSNQLRSVENYPQGIGCLKCGCKCIYLIRPDGTW